MTEPIGAWTVYDLLIFLFLWKIIMDVTPLLVRDILWPACVVIIRWVRRCQ